VARKHELGMKDRSLAGNVWRWDLSVDLQPFSLTWFVPQELCSYKFPSKHCSSGSIFYAENTSLLFLSRDFRASRLATHCSVISIHTEHSSGNWLIPTGLSMTEE